MDYQRLIFGTQRPAAVVISTQSLRMFAEYWLDVGYQLGLQDERASVREHIRKKLATTGTAIEHRKLPSDALETRKAEREVLVSGRTERIQPPSPQKPLRARVETVGDSVTRCTVYFHGIPLPVAFPTSVITHHKLVEGSDFDWFRARGRRALPADIKPVCYDPEVSNEEKERLRKFVERGRSLEDILSDFDE